MLRLLMCAGGVCVLAAGAGLAAAVGLRAPEEKAAALGRLAAVAASDSSSEPAVAADSALRPIPARLLGPEAPVPIPPAVLRVRNGWLVSDGRTLVAVYAGSAGNDPSVGRLVIVRQDLAAGTQTVRALDAGPTGALAIAAAPLGDSVETSAQAGRILVRAADGRALGLDLASSALTRPSRSAATVARRWAPRSSDSASYSFRR